MEILAIVGGDLRQKILSVELKRRGYEVRTFGLGENTGTLAAVIDGVNTVILPVPATRDGERIPMPLSRDIDCSFSDLLASLSCGSHLLGGMLPDEWIQQLSLRGIRATDYFCDECFQLRNALPTAEGAICLAMEAIPATLFGTRISVVGYGRIGALLTKKLVSLGANVTVFARSPIACANAELQGANACLMKEKLVFPPDCRVVFNTVPSRVIQVEDLQLLSPGCVLIELASSPGGFDVREAKNAGLRVIPAPGLPGRFYPESAGKILAETVCAILCADG